MSDTAGEQESKEARAESVERQLEDEAPPHDPTRERVGWLGPGGRYR